MSERTRLTQTERETRRFYEITDGSLPDMLSHSRTPFRPEIIEVRDLTFERADGHRAASRIVVIRGLKTRGNGRGTETSYEVTASGIVQPHHRNGEAPTWLRVWAADLWDTDRTA